VTDIPAAPTTRVPRLSYFFPAHNEEANVAGLVEDALDSLPAIAETFEIIAVNDGSRDRTRAIADELTAQHPGIVRAVHHKTNLGYGAALRSGSSSAYASATSTARASCSAGPASTASMSSRKARSSRPSC
jgi:cellulose synthase/poly-beta-1,6-N-acetylglucosamine synthase-like glycosyltransferase